MAGHEVLELSFNITVGGMPKYEYFGDGSFLHSQRTWSFSKALARIGNDPESFVFLAADSVYLRKSSAPQMRYHFQILYMFLVYIHSPSLRR
jgi:hypothetical protein